MKVLSKLCLTLITFTVMTACDLDPSSTDTARSKELYLDAEVSFSDIETSIRVGMLDSAGDRLGFSDEDKMFAETDDRRVELTLSKKFGPLPRYNFVGILDLIGEGDRVVLEYHRASGRVLTSVGYGPSSFELTVTPDIYPRRFSRADGVQILLDNADERFQTDLELSTFCDGMSETETVTVVLDPSETTYQISAAQLIGSGALDNAECGTALKVSRISFGEVDSRFGGGEMRLAFKRRASLSSTP